MKAAALGVLLEPAAQARPLAKQRLVGDLDGALVDREQAGLGEHGERPGGVRVALELELVERNAAANERLRRLLLLRAGQAQQHRPGPEPLGLAQALVGVLGEARHRPLDAAGLLVDAAAKRAAVALLPELDEGCGEQRQAAGLAGDVADQRRDESRLDTQAGPAAGQLDRPAQLVAAHRPDQDLVGAHQRREIGVLGAARIEVAADREHDHQPLVGVAGALDQRVEERGALGLVATGDEGLLELVDQEHQALAGLEPVERVGDPRRGVLAPRLRHRPGEGPRELGQRALARAHHRPPPALRAGDDPVGQRRQEAGAHGRGLAAARGADDGEQGRADQAGDELGDQALAAEEVLGVGGIERRQAAEGADRRLRGIRRLLDGVEAGTFAGPLQVDHTARYRCLSRAQLGLIVRRPARRRGQPLGHLRPRPAAGGAVNAKRHPLALGEQCRHGDDDALGGVERGDFGRRILAQRVEPQPLGGAALQQGRRTPAGPARRDEGRRS